MADNQSSNLPPLDVLYIHQRKIKNTSLVGGKLEAQICPYSGWAIGQRIKLWIGSADNEREGEYLSPEVSVVEKDKGLKVYFAADLLRKYNHRKISLGYNVNGGKLSSKVILDVDIS
ncbi:hypothetical protein ACIPZF_08425 [Pseudomonas sp. NPDC089752]|uniref:hypothetical protein n=1 Tax=Pseudomonas sp. NPDC089752 TaxID=3364472 RepID=UPI0037F7F267